MKIISLTFLFAAIYFIAQSSYEAIKNGADLKGQLILAGCFLIFSLYIFSGKTTKNK